MPRVKRKVRRGTNTLGKDAWQIIGPGGALLRETSYGEGATLGLAQSIALNEHAEPVELIVRLKALFGPPDPFYRVTRMEDGAIVTSPIK